MHSNLRRALTEITTDMLESFLLDVYPAEGMPHF